MKFSYPYIEKDIKEVNDVVFGKENKIFNLNNYLKYVENNKDEGGYYPIGTNHLYHGGVHLRELDDKKTNLPLPVRAIADGEVVAYRTFSEAGKEYVIGGPGVNKPGSESVRGDDKKDKTKSKKKYDSTSFVLLKHKVKLAEKGSAPFDFYFYSLYMHLLPWYSYFSDKDKEHKTELIPLPEFYRYSEFKVKETAHGKGIEVKNISGNSTDIILPKGVYVTAVDSIIKNQDEIIEGEYYPLDPVWKNTVPNYNYLLVKYNHPKKGILYGYIALNRNGKQTTVYMDQTSESRREYTPRRGLLLWGNVKLGKHHIANPQPKEIVIRSTKSVYKDFLTNTYSETDAIYKSYSINPVWNGVENKEYILIKYEHNEEVKYGYVKKTSITQRNGNIYEVTKNESGANEGLEVSLKKGGRVIAIVPKDENVYFEDAEIVRFAIASNQDKWVSISSKTYGEKPVLNKDGNKEEKKDKKENKVKKYYSDYLAKPGMVNVKYLEERVINEPMMLDGVFIPEKANSKKYKVKAGDIIGYPGTVYDKKFVHLELFTEDLGFIEKIKKNEVLDELYSYDYEFPPDNGTSITKFYKKNDIEPVKTIEKDTILRLEEKGSGSKTKKARLVSTYSKLNKSEKVWIPTKDLSYLCDGKGFYNVIKDTTCFSNTGSDRQLLKMQYFGPSSNKGSSVKKNLIVKRVSTKDKEYKSTCDKYRLVYLSDKIPEEKIEKLWVKWSEIIFIGKGSLEIYTINTDINAYKNDPFFYFDSDPQKLAKQERTDIHLTERIIYSCVDEKNTYQTVMQDGKKWIRFLIGGKDAWIKEDEVKNLKVNYNLWDEFFTTYDESIRQEEESKKYNKPADGICYIHDLNVGRLEKELEICEKKLNKFKVHKDSIPEKNALIFYNNEKTRLTNEKNKAVALRDGNPFLTPPKISSKIKNFRNCAVKHPTEWSKITNSKTNLKLLTGDDKPWGLAQDAVDKIYEKIEKFTWLEPELVTKIKTVEEFNNFPSANNLWYFHPATFIDHLKKLKVVDDIWTDWPDEFKYHRDWVFQGKSGRRQVKYQNKYNNLILKAWLQYSMVDPLIMKSLIAMESNYDPSAQNPPYPAHAKHGGLTQIRDIYWPTSISKNLNDRFVPEISILGGFHMMRNFIREARKYTKGQSLSKEEQWEFNLGCYNAGGGVVKKALEKAKSSNFSNPKWNDLLKDSDIENSFLFYGIKQTYGWDDSGTKEKYKEVKVYVEYIIKRAKQSELFLKF